MRHLILASTTTLAAATLFILGDSVAVLSSVLWGAFSLAGMRDGLRSASKENWKRPIGWLGSLVIHGALVLLLGAPAILFAFVHGVIPAVASAWLILVTMGVFGRFLHIRFGPITNPYDDELERCTRVGGTAGPESTSNAPAA